MGVRVRNPPPGDPDYKGPIQFKPNPPPAPPDKRTVEGFVVIGTDEYIRLAVKAYPAKPQ